MQVALELTEQGHEVWLLEKGKSIFCEISGQFGIRLHTGSHYPRSIGTRKDCHSGFSTFKETYPELLINNSHAIYGLGNLDAHSHPPKVTAEQFNSVCSEFQYRQQIDTANSEYENLICAVDMEEPSILLGDNLRVFFKKRLEQAGVKILYHQEITGLEEVNGKVEIHSNDAEWEFDYVVNATSFKTLLPDLDELSKLPFNAEVVYQPCIALVYEDNIDTNGIPLSFIVMDGWFPCLMPYADDKIFTGKYILTHGSWTILGSYASVDEADGIIDKLTDEFVETEILPNCEFEMQKFWPAFKSRFTYRGWKGASIAKLKTNREFRSAVVFEKSNIAYIVPGKISNVFDAAHETAALIDKKNVITTEYGYSYIQDGLLSRSLQEIEEPILNIDRNTCNLQTYDAIHNSKKQTNNENIIPTSPLVVHSFLKQKAKQTKLISPKLSPAQPKHVTPNILGQDI